MDAPWVLTVVGTAQAPSQVVGVVGKEQNKRVNVVVLVVGNEGLGDRAWEGEEDEY